MSPAPARPTARQVALWDCNGGTNQQWTPTASRQLKVYGTKCLDASGDGTADGAGVQIYDCTGGTNQQWTVNPDGTVVGVAPASASTPRPRHRQRHLLAIWTCNGGANQRWSRT